MKRTPGNAAAVLFFVPFLLAPLACSESPPVVENGLQVSLLYEAKNPEGSLVDANPDEGPLVFVVGAGKVQPNFEAKLLGLKLGERKTITVEEAYGPYDDKKTGLIVRSALPEEAKVGDEIEMADGFPSRIKEFREDMAVLDLNHPLAGLAITFDVQIVDIRKPESDKAD